MEWWFNRDRSKNQDAVAKSKVRTKQAKDAIDRLNEALDQVEGLLKGTPDGTPSNGTKK